MGSFEWKKSQELAFTDPSATILVSAAAGSGKSTVLTERILRHLTDKNDPVDLENMVIVTFTKAAAAELRDKISNKLNKALEDDPANPRLTSQLLALNRAHISTIDSFCYDLIRSNFQALGLSSSVRIGETNECKLLRSEVMESVIEDFFDGLPGTEKVKDFALFYEYFVSGKSDAAEGLFLSLYEALKKYPEGLSRLLSVADRYDEARNLPFFSTEWGKVAESDAKRMFSHYLHLYELMIDEMSREPLCKDKLPVFQSDKEQIERILFFLNKGDYEAFAEFVIEFKFDSLATGKRPGDLAVYKTAQAVRDAFKKALKKLIGSGAFLPPDEYAEYANAGAALVRDLYEFLTYFEKRLNEEKRKRNLLDFTDLECYAYRLLVKDGEPTETAKAVSEQFREFYIDEYQDTNELQDAIFRAAACNSKRFMVGDVKQSIYGFRGSVPALFSAYRYDENVKTICLQENFRSERPVLEFDNVIFDYLFRHGSGEMPYEPTDALVFGKTPGNEYPVELAILEKPEDKAEEVTAEADYVASRVKKLMKEGRKAGEITILLRSPKAAGKQFEEALARAGVPCLLKEEHDLFENPHVLLYLCLLNCIDNPRRDVYLAGLMRSPLYGFSLDDLVQIRTYGSGPLWDALREYAAKTEDPKAQRILDKLAQYRKWAFSTPVDRLVWRLFEDTSAFSMTVGDGSDAETDREKLLHLYEHARQFENGSFKGLYQFLRYLNDIIEAGEKMPVEETPENDDTVKIMSAHSSKGLQFPVCILARCGKGFNLVDLKKPLLFERTLGLASRYNDETGLARISTPFHEGVKRKMKENIYDEEMRLLYVALTRAQEQLIVTGSVDDADALLNKAQAAKGLDDTGASILIGEQKDYLSWILCALRASGYDGHIETVIRRNDADTETEEEEETAVSSGRDGEDTALTERLKERFSFVYPHEALSSLPAKMTVSKLKPDMLDPDEEGVLDLSAPRPTDFTIPSFLQAKTATGADRGTATHLFMQFCDLKNAKENGIEAEIRRLTEKQFLPPETAKLIRREHLEGFFSSSLYAEMIGASSLRREVRFNVNMPASVLSLEGNFPGEELLVQGVIDCYFLGSDGRVTLVDYKTDSIPKELIGDRAKEDSFLLERHESQLRYYRIALEKILCRPVDRVLLWSFSLGREVAVPIRG